MVSLSRLFKLTEPCLNDITTYLSPLVAELAGSAAPLPPDTEPEIAKLNKLRQLLYAQLGRESRYNMHIMQDHALDEPVRVLELETDVLTFIHKQPLPVSVLFECEVDAAVSVAHCVPLSSLPQKALGAQNQTSTVGRSLSPHQSGQAQGHM